MLQVDSTYYLQGKMPKSPQKLEESDFCYRLDEETKIQDKNSISRNEDLLVQSIDQFEHADPFWAAEERERIFGKNIDPHWEFIMKRPVHNMVVLTKAQQVPQISK